VGYIPRKLWHSHMDGVGKCAEIKIKIPVSKI
jgi:hypothetical protein